MMIRFFSPLCIGGVLILLEEGELCGCFHCLVWLAAAVGGHRFDAADLAAA